jgi:hypothetical protein
VRDRTGAAVSVARKRCDRPSRARACEQVRVTRYPHVEKLPVQSFEAIVVLAISSAR